MMAVAQVVLLVAETLHGTDLTHGVIGVGDGGDLARTGDGFDDDALATDGAR